MDINVEFQYIFYSILFKLNRLEKFEKDIQGLVQHLLRARIINIA